MPSQSPPQPASDTLLVLFDGECALCDGAVRWLLKRDGAGHLRFAASGSAAGAAWLQQCGIAIDSIIAIADPGGAGQQVLVRSDAVLAVLRQLPAPWPAFAALAGIVPRPLRNLAYRLVARARYRLFGRLPSCSIPVAADRGRFL